MAPNHEPLPDEELSRPRLVMRLEQGALERSVTVLCAPAGYGKSTVLRHVVRAWLRRGIAVATPARGRDEHVWPVTPGETHPMVMVLDELHSSSNAGWESATAETIAHLPFQGHVVLAIRHAPPPLVSSALCGVSHEILRADDLRFNPSECIALLTSQQARAHAGSWGREIHRLTEGWPVAVDALARLAARFGRPGAAASDAASTRAAHGAAWERYVRERIGDLDATAQFETAGVEAPTNDKSSPLTAREREVLRLTAEGLENKAIAGQLFVSVATVKAHLSRVFRKFNVGNRTAAVAHARALRILGP